MKKQNKTYIHTILIGLCVLICGSIHYDEYHANAQEQKVEYSYDALGRLIKAEYENGSTIEYQYDKNGNIINMNKTTEATEQPSDTTESTEGSGNKEETTDKGNTTTESQSNKVDSNTSTVIDKTEQENIKETVSNANTHLTAAELKEYNKFKKKKPVIKSLKGTKKGKKRYLKIQIKQVAKWGLYGETGYQIKYATKKNFKKAKTVKVTRKKNKKVTTKKWKVKKKKTYYVKVRAYIKTRTGKTFYSKYSKVKKIKVK